MFDTIFFNGMFFLFRYAHDGGKSRKGTLTLEVPRVTNIKFLLTISIHNQEKGFNVHVVERHCPTGPGCSKAG